MAHNLEEINFEEDPSNCQLIQKCTVRKSNIRNNANYYELTCLTCNQTGYFVSEFAQGKATGLHFADKDKYPIS
jgi:hypothetical protein